MVIYLTTNLLNGKKYVGKDARNQKWYLGSGKYLKKAIKKYGKENFKKEILEECSNMEELNLAEIKWLRKLNCKEDSTYYNATDTITPSSFGKKLTEEHKRKISESNKGKKLSNEHKKVLSEKRKGVKRGPHSPETKKKISQSLKGIVWSNERNQNVSKGKKGKPQFHNRVKIAQLNPETLEVIKVYDKITDINSNGFNSRSLSNNLKKGSKIYKGFLWIKQN